MSSDCSKSPVCSLTASSTRSAVREEMRISSALPFSTKDAVETEINGYAFRYLYKSEERLLRAEYIDGGFTFSIMIEGLTQHGAERILNSIS